MTAGDEGLTMATAEEEARRELDILGPEYVQLRLATFPPSAATAHGDVVLPDGRKVGIDVVHRWLAEHVAEANRRRQEREERMATATESAARASRSAARAAWGAVFAALVSAAAGIFQGLVAMQQIEGTQDPEETPTALISVLNHPRAGR